MSLLNTLICFVAESWIRRLYSLHTQRPGTVGLACKTLGKKANKCITENVELFLLHVEQVENEPIHNVFVTLLFAPCLILILMHFIWGIRGA